jgi:hypothetical protein
MGGCGSKDGVSDPKKGKSLPQEMFKTSEELIDFSTFFHESSKSALKKCLTEEIWNEYKDQSDD